jgi:hypothetical protein
MGTKSDWISVALTGGIWLLGDILWTHWLADSETRFKPVWPAMYFLGTALIGVSVGMGIAFQWRAFRSPLVFLNAAAFGGAMLAGLSLRRKRKETSQNDD